MEHPWLPFLLDYVVSLPIAFVRLKDDEWNELNGTRGGTAEFSLVRRHTEFDRIKARQICIVSKLGGMPELMRIGLVTSAAGVASLDSRLKFRFGREISVTTSDELISLITDPQSSGILRKRLDSDGSILALSPQVSRQLIEGLANIEANSEALRRIHSILSVPKRFQNNLALQEDALRLAFKVFDIQPHENVMTVEVSPDGDSALARYQFEEDGVIDHDARSIPGWTFSSSEMTGRAIFTRDEQVLEVITANQRRLEECFGVDLIYFNESQRNIVMVQYKMLERAGEDWIYRPTSQLDEEITRMDFFDQRIQSEPAEFRLHSGMFYLKLVKRDGALSEPGMLLPLQHFKAIRDADESIGPKGGIRISYKSLGGSYLRRDPFVELIGAGYIGSHGGTTAAIHALMEEILKGNRAVIAAIQKSIKSEAELEE